LLNPEKGKRYSHDPLSGRVIFDILVEILQAHPPHHIRKTTGEKIIKTKIGS
jgi:hypothetical protein